mmetsp:Transcript_7041/g.14747  ORF Transcript_7041/g.14747 Transcript_7041/m.14747 type:complete len:167 (-) Transcript_7041:1627-2127(-)
MTMKSAAAAAALPAAAATGLLLPAALLAALALPALLALLAATVTIPVHYVSATRNYSTAAFATVRHGRHRAADVAGGGADAAGKNGDVTPPTTFLKSRIRPAFGRYGIRLDARADVQRRHPLYMSSAAATDGEHKDKHSEEGKYKEEEGEEGGVERNPCSSTTGGG